MSNKPLDAEETLLKAAVESLLYSVITKKKPDDASEFGKALGEELLAPLMGDFVFFIRSKFIPKDPNLDTVKIGRVTCLRDELCDVAAAEGAFHIGITAMLLSLTALAEQGRSCAKPMEYLTESMENVAAAWATQKDMLLEEFHRYGKEYAAAKREQADLANKLSGSSLQPSNANLQ